MKGLLALSIVLNVLLTLALAYTLSINMASTRIKYRHTEAVFLTDNSVNTKQESPQASVQPDNFVRAEVPKSEMVVRSYIRSDTSSETRYQSGRPFGNPSFRGRTGTNPELIQQRHVRKFAREIKDLFDDNHDGVLGSDEKKSLIAELEEEPLTNDSLQAHAMAWKVIKEIDADGNLEISDEEAVNIHFVMSKLHSEFEAKRSRNPGRRDGGRLPGGRTDSFGVRSPRYNVQNPPVPTNE